MSQQVADSNIKIINLNKRAKFDYHIIESFEAGIVLTGAEIKSVKIGEISLAESYIRPENNEIFLIRAHIKPYSYSGDREYDPMRKRKLLLKRSEIDKLLGRVQAKGLTLVPLKVYLKRGMAKIEVGVAKGKSAGDKRSVIKERESKREVERAIKNRK